MDTAEKERREILAGPIALSPDQKLHALAHRFYQSAKWEPKPGDYYTTSRADLELYQVVDVRDGMVFTRYCDPSKGVGISDWPQDEFLSPETFGRCRVHVPAWIFTSFPAPKLEPGKHSPLPFSMDYEESDTGIGKVDVWVIKDATGRTILDAHNSSAMLVMEEHDEDGRRQWDEQSRLDCAFMVEACNAYRAMAEAERRAFERGLEEAAKVAEEHGEPYAMHTATGAMMFRACTEKIASAIRSLPTPPLSKREGAGE